MIRIDKFLSQMQVATRSESKKLIKMKRITKNGALVTDGGEKCDPRRTVSVWMDTPSLIRNTII